MTISLGGQRDDDRFLYHKFDVKMDTAQEITDRARVSCLLFPV